MTAEYTINAYETNQVKIYAVEGEADSRRVIFNIVEKSGTVAAVSNAKPANLMLDLTGMTAVFVVFDSYKKIECTGTITDARGGVVEFLLTPETAQLPGKKECTIELKKASGKLRIAGITLDVQEISGYRTISICRGTAWSDAVTVLDDGKAYILGNTEKLVFQAKSGERILIHKELTSSDYNTDAGGYLLFLSSEQTNISPGKYYYNIKLKRADGEYEPVIFKSEFIIEE